MTSYLNEYVEWRDDPYWRKRRLNPSQLLIHDISLEEPKAAFSSMLEMKEVLPSSFSVALEDKDRLARELSTTADGMQSHEQQHLKSLIDEYGWMHCLRCPKVEENSPVVDQLRRCRWIHIPSKFPEYLHGCLLAFSDWSEHMVIPNLIANRQLEAAIHQNERFSKHGRYFAPFAQSLNQDLELDAPGADEYPFIISVPFVDWTVAGEPPPLRFQVDPREGFQSSRSSSHLLRSLLQHYYRLEDTFDREKRQVFAKHKPWENDRLLDLKTRRWYGRYPEGLNVDELWILVIDVQHIVTFSSNMSWKSRWPPLQLPSRIAEVSFRSIRNSLFLKHNNAEYTAYTHVIACLNGAVGLLHRSFWPDIPLCLTDRYAGYLSHVQYRLLRAPSSKLVTELLQLQEELSIVMQITKQQLDLIDEIQSWLKHQTIPKASRMTTADTLADHNPRERRGSQFKLLPHTYWATARQHGYSQRSNPMSQVLENLKREYSDLRDLHESTGNLIDRTIKLVNLRLEDHGKAILVFTVVTVIFLPLSFISSFFGMNFVDIRNMTRKQGFFWVVAGTATAIVLALSMLLAFSGGSMLEKFLDWKEQRRSKRRRKLRPHRHHSTSTAEQGYSNFEVLDAAKVEDHVS